MEPFGQTLNRSSRSQIVEAYYTDNNTEFMGPENPILRPGFFACAHKALWLL